MDNPITAQVVETMVIVVANSGGSILTVNLYYFSLTITLLKLMEECQATKKVKGFHPER